MVSAKAAAAATAMSGGEQKGQRRVTRQDGFTTRFSGEPVWMEEEEEEEERGAPYRREYQGGKAWLTDLLLQNT